MQKPVFVTFHGQPSSPALAQAARESSTRLEPHDWMCCHVRFERWHQHHQHGHSERVVVRVVLPKSDDVTVQLEPVPEGGQETLACAIHRAFGEVALKVAKELEHPHAHRRAV